MASYAGDLRPPVGRFAIIAARFNEFVVGRLAAGAKQGLQRHGVADTDIDEVSVPGSLEIPVAAKRLAESGRYVALICCGAVIRGETGHYDHVADQSAAGIAGVAVQTGVPVLNAILACDTLEQAINRAGGKAGNKGYDVAVAAVEMANLLASLPKAP